MARVPVRPCARCNGTGAIPYGIIGDTKTCPTCGGKGHNLIR